jgi:hypothetical protein
MKSFLKLVITEYLQKSYKFFLTLSALLLLGL